MKKIILIFLLLVPSALFAQTMNIITFNIRYNNHGDGINAWPYRIDMVNGLLRFHDPDIFGLQEALYDQIIDVADGLQNYTWFGVGREDGEKGGEFSPVFYKKEAYQLLDKGHFWLSETPDQPTIGWDAAFKRIVTWGKFKSKKSGQEFLFFNTHFDHMGVEARKNSARTIIEKIKQINANNLPVVLTGDFNLTPDEKPIRILKDYFRDTREVSSETPYGPVGTFSGFDINADLSQGRIDYIFVKGDINVLKYAVLTDWKDQRYPSDHLPVFAKIQLQ